MRKPRRTFVKTCINCGRDMVVKTNAALRCEECRKELRRKDRERQRYGEGTKAKAKPPKMSIAEVIRATVEYNREHGTCISEGKFVSLMERGML